MATRQDGRIIETPTEARQGAILEAAHDAIITIDQHLHIREFNPAAEQMFGGERMNMLGRNFDLLLPPAQRETQRQALSQYMARGEGPLGRRQLELRGLRADGAEFPIEVTVARIGSFRFEFDEPNRKFILTVSLNLWLPDSTCWRNLVV